MNNILWWIIGIIMLVLFGLVFGLLITNSETRTENVGINQQESEEIEPILEKIIFYLNFPIKEDWKSNI